MARYTIVVCILSLQFLQSACNVVQPYILTIRANYRYNSGEFQGALLDYLQVQKQKRYEHWIDYNLGNLYLTLGETQSALRLWMLAERSSAAAIQFASSFNRGILYYEQGMYDQAYEEFKRALIVSPSSVDAKINLELTLDKLQASSKLSHNTQRKDVDDSDDPKAESIRIIEYMRRKEQQWRKKETELETYSENSQDW